MTTPQGDRHAAYRSMAGGTVGQYNEDLAAASEVVTGKSGLSVNGMEMELLKVLTGSNELSLGGLQAAYAAQLGVSNWSAVSILPSMAFGFDTGRTTLPSSITFTRASVGTAMDSSGDLQTYAINVPRFDHNSSGVPLGLLIEGETENILFNSLTPATQTRTIANATQYTTSLVGTGSLVLSDGLSGTVTEGSPVTATSTSTSGTFTLTGSADGIQCETGSSASSIVPTAGASAARAPDIATMTGTNFSDWFNQSEGSFVAGFTLNSGGFGGGRVLNIGAGNQSPMYGVANYRVGAYDGTSNPAVGADFADTSPGVLHKASMSYGSGGITIMQDGDLANAGTSGYDGSWTGDELQIGRRDSFNFLFGTLSQIQFYSTPLSPAQLQALTT